MRNCSISYSQEDEVMKKSVVSIHEYDNVGTIRGGDTLSRQSPLLLLQLILFLCLLDTVVSETCNAGFSAIETHPDLVHLIDASTTTSSSPTDLKGTDLIWIEKNTVNFVAASNNIGPYWDLSAGYFETSTSRVLGSSYTLFYYWNPGSGSDKDLHWGGTCNDYWTLASSNSLGFWASGSVRNSGDWGFKDTGYDITIDTWQTLIVTGVANDVANGIGTSTYYVNGVHVGTVERVASGDTTKYIGSYNPGYVAVAGVLNIALDVTEINALHNHMASTKTSTGCSACPSGKTSDAGLGEVCQCLAGYSRDDTNRVCNACVVGKYKAVTGNADCLVCDTNASDCGLRTDGTNTTPGICDPGYEGDASTQSCIACSIGNYKADSGNVDCTICDANATGCGTDGSGGGTNVSAGTCKPGYEGDASTQSCIACSIGTFKADSGNVDCTICDTHASSTCGLLGNGSNVAEGT